MITIWTIYDHPLDFPEKWVVRAQDIVGGLVLPRPNCTCHDSLQAAREAIPQGTIRIDRSAQDAPCIAEVWI